MEIMLQQIKKVVTYMIIYHKFKKHETEKEYEYFSFYISHILDEQGQKLKFLQISFQVILKFFCHF